MANDITTQVLEDGLHNTIIKWTLIGANKTGDETDTVVFDASAYKTASIHNKLYKLQYTLVGISASLYWDATTNLLLFSLPGNEARTVNFEKYGGIINNAGAGKTGDILISTNNMNDGDSAVLVLWVQERELDLVR